MLSLLRHILETANYEYKIKTITSTHHLTIISTTSAATVLTAISVRMCNLW
jgi:hypothetical protein